MLNNRAAYQALYLTWGQVLGAPQAQPAAHRRRSPRRWRAPPPQSHCSRFPRRSAWRTSACAPAAVLRARATAWPCAPPLSTDSMASHSAAAGAAAAAAAPAPAAAAVRLRGAVWLASHLQHLESCACAVRARQIAVAGGHSRADWCCQSVRLTSSKALCGSLEASSVWRCQTRAHPRVGSLAHSRSVCWQRCA